LIRRTDARESLVSTIGDYMAKLEDGVEFVPALGDKYVLMYMIKGSLGGETSVLRTFRMSGKELVKERVSPGKS